MKTKILINTILFFVLFITTTAFAQTRTRNFVLNWTDNATTETGFGIERSTSPTGTFTELIRVVGANLVQYTDVVTDVEGAQRCYRVFAFNSTDESTRSNVACGTIPITIPTAATNLVAVLNPTSTVTLNWTDNSDNETSFKIQRKTSVAGVYSQVGSVTSGIRTFTDSPPVVSNTQYFYRVVASNSAGDSNFSNEVSVLIPSQAPVAPSNLTVQTLSSTGAMLRWEDQNIQLTRTDIYRRRSNQNYVFISSVSPNTLQYIDNNLRRNTSYCWTLRDLDGNLASAFSNPACIRTPRN